MRFPTGEEVLDGAAKAIEEQGWCQHMMQNAEGNLCLMGGLLHGARQTQCPGFYEAAQAVEDQVKQQTGASLVALWNDEPGRSVEDVLLLLKRAKETL